MTKTVALIQIVKDKIEDKIALEFLNMSALV